ncbi:MAG TPA: tryptophan halogenase family protein [Sphingomonas sp.]|jgi:tryptophan halogenase
MAALRVVIIGGGTAGWMTAAAVAGVLNRSIVDVRLIESEEIGIVGVGEATLPHLSAFIARLGIDEAEFMAATNATFKLGIEFRDWARLGDSYIHPFGAFGHDAGGVGFHHYWRRAHGTSGSPIEAYSLPIVAARANRFAPPVDDPTSLLATFGYAYQFDATRFAPFLRRYSEERGVRRTEGRVVDVTLDSETGFVASVTLADGEVVSGDLFIDCSGFRSLLLGRTLGEPFEDWSRWLPCDRAVAVPCGSTAPLAPYTTATAMDAGWRWRIPLQHRVGNGYVYASDHLGDDAAAQALLSAIEGEPQAEPRFLRFKAGRRRRSWVGNTIAVGLAGGFLEPLESTSIYLIQLAITTLLELFPERELSAIDRDEFNRVVDLEYDRIRDFLILHYHATERDDTPFWNRMRTMTVPDSLTEKMELFRRRGRVVKYREGVFLDASWIAVYLGQRILPQAYDPRADAPPPAALAAALDRLRAETEAAVATMPDHAAYLAVHRASANAERPLWT